MKNNIMSWVGLLLIGLMLGYLGSLSQPEPALAASAAWLQATATPSPLPTVAPAVSDESVIQRIRERGKLLAGVKYDFKPFGYLDDDGQVVGFDIDLMQAMADEWGVEVEFVQVTSANRIPKLAAGDVDIVAASMTHKKERDETIDFSQTYFLDGQSLLVRRDANIKTIQDLDGKAVAAIQGSTSIDQIQGYAAEKDVTLEILPFQEYPQALEALKAGQVDSLTTDSVALSQFAQDDLDLIVVGGLFTQEPYGLGVPAGDSYFNDLVNFTLQKLKTDGTYDQLYAKWFGEAATPYPIEILPGEWPYTFDTSPVLLNKPLQSKVEQILTEGKFVAGVKYDFEPFGYLDDDDNLVGFDVDLMQEFARRWLGDEDAVELVQVTSANRIPKLAAGDVDIVAASMTHKQERDETIDFSQTYFLDGQSLLVRYDAGIAGVSDLQGKTVAAIQGSTSIDQIQAYATANGVTIEILPFQEYPQALEALKADQVAALTTDSVALSQFAKGDITLHVVGGNFTQEPYGLGVPNYDHRFRDLVNFTLQAMKDDGSYDAMYCKWFGATPPYDIEIWPGQAQDEQLQTMTEADAPFTFAGAENCLPVTTAPVPTDPITTLPSDPLTTVPPEQGTPTTFPFQYTVVQGDSLSLIAGKFYNDIRLWPHIYEVEANRTLIGNNPNLILPAMIFTIPELP